MSNEIMIENIRKAQKEIELKKEIVRQGKMRQGYHFMPETGWLNDPNGLIYFQGKYHFFYQLNPYYGFWDYMHWGHAVSSDMLHWEYLPIALAPSESYDDYYRGGCFSGSAIEHDGKLYLIFTTATAGKNGVVQTQSIAWSEDGINFKKYEGNPVLKAPSGIKESDFRDPKVWKNNDKFYMVCGSKKDNKAQALLYRSNNLIDWEFVNVLAESRGELGYMWECPDFYKLGNKYILTFSPMGAGERKNIYLIGDFDYNTGKFDYHSLGELDWGLDYYAPHSFVAPDKRRIVVSWANGWDWMEHWKDWGPTYKEGWCGFFNIPREVKLLDNYKLQFIPIKELKELRTSKSSTESMLISTKQEIALKDGVFFEMKFSINLVESNASRFEIRLRAHANKSLKYIFDLKKAELIVDRNEVDDWSKGVSKSVLFLKDKEKLDIHIYSDNSSVEIFTDNYTNNHSTNIYATKEQNRVYFDTLNGSIKIENLEIYTLKNVYI